MTNKKIFIGGDSWGCGEWDINGNLSHGGIAQYFNKDTHKVINVSRAGASNNQSIIRLHTELKSNYATGDLIFWIQTDPLRDVRPYFELTKKISIAGGFNQLCYNLLRTQYIRLNDIAKEFNTTIFLIGGKWDLVTEQLNDLANINPIVESWAKIIFTDTIDFYPFRTNTSDWTIKNIDLSTYPKDFAKLVVDEVYYLEQCFNILQNNLDLFLDGAHPSRHGHWLLYNYLTTQIK
jgi:hypothetical protein